MQVVVNGKLVSYDDAGKGEVIVFVHGWLDSKKTFEPLIKLLSKDYRCVALDLPNFGASEQAEDIISIDDYAEFIAEFIKKLEIKDYILLGHSMGGQIIIRGTSKGVLKPKKVVLIASAGLRNKQAFRKKMLKIGAKVAKHFATAKVKNRFYEKIGSDYSTDLSPLHKKIIASVLSDDVAQDARRIKCPALLIYGEEDQHTPPWMGEELANLIAGSKLITVSGFNHWVHQQVPDELATRIKDFLK